MVIQAKRDVTIDLRTRVVTDNDRMFVLFPGKSHKFYDEFQTKGSIYLDLPGFPVARGELNAPSPVEIGKRLLLSARVRTWHGRDKPADAEPNRDLTKYRDLPIPKTRVQLAGAARELYFGLKKGELVLIPGPGYFSDVLVGEIADEIGSGHSVASRDYKGERVPARRVNWLAKIPKWNLTEDLIKRLQLRSPLVLLEKSLREEIYSISFPNYINLNVYNAKFETTKIDFSSRDDLSLQLFVNHISAILEQTDLYPDQEGVVSLAEALSIIQTNFIYIPELAIEINSPGFVSTISEKVTPLVVAALIALALSGHADAKDLHVHVKNSLAPDAACVLDVNDRVNKTLQRFATDEWKSHCDRMHSTHQRTGLKTHVTAQNGKG